MAIKELEAFNELKEGHWFDFADTYFSLNPKLKMDLGVIEIALERLEKYDALNLTCDEMQFIADIIKNPEHQLDKLKAFEIIKEKINRQALLHLLSIEVKNKEDFDFLKKVLGY